MKFLTKSRCGCKPTYKPFCDAIYLKKYTSMCCISLGRVSYLPVFCIFSSKNFGLVQESANCIGKVIEKDKCAARPTTDIQGKVADGCILLLNSLHPAQNIYTRQWGNSKKCIITQNTGSKLLYSKLQVKVSQMEDYVW